MKIYMTLIDNEQMTVTPLEQAGTVTVDGTSYWLVRMPKADDTQVLPNGEDDIESRVREMVAGGHHSVERISRMLGVTAHMVGMIIKQYNMETPADRVRRRFRAALNTAGEAGLTSPELSALAGPEHRNATGPVLATMMRHGEIRRLEDGRWARRT